MIKPDGVPDEAWIAFHKYEMSTGSSFGEHEDDWMPWWSCWYNGWIAGHNYVVKAGS